MNFRGPALLEDLKSRPYPSYAFWDLVPSRRNSCFAATKPDVDPSVFRDKIVFVGATGAALFDVFETPFAGGKMPGIQVHAAVADDILSNRFITPSRRRRARGDRRRLRDAGRAGRDVAAGVVGDAASRLPVHRRVRPGRRHAAVRGRLLDEPVAAGAGDRRWRCLAASPTSTSSRAARSGR